MNKDFIYFLFFNEGFKEGKGVCCGSRQFRRVFNYGGKRLGKEFQLCTNPNEYLFWDSYHLTQRVYKQLAYQMWNETRKANSVWPYNLRDLFQAF